mgnify:CR=1 FL=1
MNGGLPLPPIPRRKAWLLPHGAPNAPAASGVPLGPATQLNENQQNTGKAEMKNSFGGVLFDLDGTLLDTLEDLANSMNTALHRLGFEGHPVADYRYYVGDGTEILARRVLPPTHRNERTVEQCVEAMLAEYQKRWHEKTRPYTGVPDLLDALMARRIPMAILSNKKHEFTQLTVSRLLPNWQFTAVVGAKPGVPKKPDPTAALQIAADLHLQPENLLYVGDTNTDMQTATAAGMYPVGALWGFRTEEELRATGAKAIIARPQDLLPYLG